MRRCRGGRGVGDTIATTIAAVAATATIGCHASHPPHRFLIDC